MRPRNRQGGRLEQIAALRWPRPVAVAFCCLLGFVSPAAYGLVSGFPEPTTHDEFSYLLGAQTFAVGRLTNAAPAFPEFFEAPHILVVPTYASKYPPGQAALLALGYKVAGSPIWGVWLSCGLFAGCLCWMLQAWTTRRWALVTTTLAILTLGTSSYWAQSYWGGMVAASGSALLLGGMRRSLCASGLCPSIAIAVGIVILTNTRPYEGLLVVLGTLAYLAAQLIRRNRIKSRSTLTLLLAPISFVLVTSIVCMSLYNRAVTGDFTSTPYAVNHAQYWHRGLFVFSRSQEPKRTPAPRVAAFYRSYHSPSSPANVTDDALINLLKATIGSLGLPFAIMRWPVNQAYQGVLLWLAILISTGIGRRTATVWSAVGAAAAESFLRFYVSSFFGLSLLLVLPPWIAAFAIMCRQYRGTLLMVATFAVLVIGQSVVRWWWPHYSAPIVPLLLAGVAATLQRTWQKSSAVQRITGPGQMLLIFAAVQMLALAASLSVTSRVHDQTQYTSPRAEIKRKLEAQGGLHLVFVEYSPNYTIHDEWVYNPADLSTARVLFVHDLGETRNRELVHYSGRAAWRVNVSAGEIHLRPYLPAD